MTNAECRMLKGRRKEGTAALSFHQRGGPGGVKIVSGLFRVGPYFDAAEYRHVSAWVGPSAVHGVPAFSGSSAGSAESF